jgi:1-phosphofructokinase
VAPALVNTTGAGDATLAGFLRSSIRVEDRGGPDQPRIDLRGALSTAVSWGALAVSLPTTLISGIEHTPESTVRDPELDRPLVEATHLTI